MNLQGIEQVIHWGAPENLLQYWQEVGRAGRSGGQAKAELFCYGASMTRVGEGMKTFIKSCKEGSCIRKSVLNGLTLSDAKKKDFAEGNPCKETCVAGECKDEMAQAEVTSAEKNLSHVFTMVL